MTIEKEQGHGRQNNAAELGSESRIRRRWMLTAALACVALAASWSTVIAAGKYNEKLAVGERPEAWSDLPAATGGKVSLEDFKDKKLVVVVFTCNTCPVAVVYQDRLIKLASDYADKSVAVVAINVNDGETLAEMKERAEEKKYPFPYLYDQSQATAKAYGATCTPHAFVLDAERSVAYMGAIDDGLREENVKTHYLRSAIDQLLAGRKPSESETRQIGCGIKWR